MISWICIAVSAGGVVGIVDMCSLKSMIGVVGKQVQSLGVA